MKLDNKNGNIEIIKDADGRSLVIVNDIRFRGRQRIDWKDVELYLKEYIGNCYEILETSEKVYVGIAMIVGLRYRFTQKTGS